MILRGAHRGGVGVLPAPDEVDGDGFCVTHSAFAVFPYPGEGVMGQAR